MCPPINTYPIQDPGIPRTFFTLRVISLPPPPPQSASSIFGPLTGFACASPLRKYSAHPPAISGKVVPSTRLSSFGANSDFERPPQAPIQDPSGDPP
ncbi:hypothetical protein B0H15DRAFT_946232 [Mycena belliarum]|uniref:Uncharacterized protein n=1 Tax=Mycena belliarum TaxID=1033014 RepID=A0AAD6UAA9_9AGAR|nr:hypothetical protein B0H15DRAFT_946232 [Mycena belliae]